MKTNQAMRESERMAARQAAAEKRRALLGAARARGWRSNRWADWAAPVAMDAATL